ncbi:MAG: hypothetical protein WC248_02880, partial [Candidatus Methanomethylophilaceae archaeon]
MPLFNLNKKPPTKVVDQDTTTVSHVEAPEKNSTVVTKPPMPRAHTEFSGTVGIIYGNVGTSFFDCRVSEHLERSEYVMINHEDY